MHFALHDLNHLLALYGYWAVLLFVAVESTGIPFPGETMLLAAAIYAGSTHRLSIPLVIAAAAAGAIIGDNIGFWVGREGGYRLLRRYGKYIRLDERKLKVGQYLFHKHGGKVVFFGRFVAVLRAWAAFLAGVNHMQWPRFLVFNAAGGILWAVIYGVGGYLLGNNVHRLTGPVGIATIAIAVVAIVAFIIFTWRNEKRLEEEAERAMPGPIDQYQPGGAKDKRGREKAEGGRQKAEGGDQTAGAKHDGRQREADVARGKPKQAATVTAEHQHDGVVRGKAEHDGVVRGKAEHDGVVRGKAEHDGVVTGKSQRDSAVDERRHEDAVTGERRHDSP